MREREKDRKRETDRGYSQRERERERERECINCVRAKLRSSANERKKRKTMW